MFSFDYILKDNIKGKIKSDNTISKYLIFITFQRKT